jgi:hypothetical protein
LTSPKSPFVKQDLNGTFSRQSHPAVAKMDDINPAKAGRQSLAEEFPLLEPTNTLLQHVCQKTPDNSLRWTTEEPKLQISLLHSARF